MMRAVDQRAGGVHAPLVAELLALRVEVGSSKAPIVDDVSLQIAPGEVLGIVGESGSGKTTLGLAMLGHTRRGARIVSGQVLHDGRDLLVLSAEERRRLLGQSMTYVPQDPRSAINPARRIGPQLAEMLAEHDVVRTEGDRRDRIRSTLDDVRLPSDDAFLRRYPHQLSGGQLQRVGLAMAFVCQPRMIVFDEPTTGLDVTTQAHVLRTIRRLCAEHGIGALYVTHDLAVVADIATRVGVMYAGRLVEAGAAEDVFAAAAHRYTRRLIRAAPDAHGPAPQGIPGSAPRPGDRPAGCAFAPRCTAATDECRAAFPPVSYPAPMHEVRCYHPHEIGSAEAAPVNHVHVMHPWADDRPVFKVRDLSASYGPTVVLHEVTFDIGRGECLALVGESGSGKTTLAQCIVGLHITSSGSMEFEGETLQARARDRTIATRRRVQCVFQNPYGSLNPRRTIGQSIEQPLTIFSDVPRRERSSRVARALEQVALHSDVARRYPDQLSGGERQRVAIARALACEPSLLVCDEITSALDVSVQASIVELLQRIQAEMGLAMLFVTHNLPLVRAIAHRAVVMADGRIVEVGNTAEVMDAPRADYTKALLADSLHLPRAVS